MVHEALVVGLGMGGPDTLTMQARDALRRSGLVIGAPRMLETVAATGLCASSRMVALVGAQKIVRELRDAREGVASVVMSGDVGLHSGATQLCALLREVPDIEVSLVPGISSLSYLCARVGVGWQDVEVASLHGRDLDVAGVVQAHAKTFVLVGGEVTPGEVCARLAARGLGSVRVSVGERLSYADERITHGTAEELAGRPFDQLSVLLVQNDRPAARPAAVPCLPDASFERGRVPMTKEEVREVALCKLRVGPADVVWDVGAGTGSVSVEAALAAGSGQVFAVERGREACELVRHNGRAFGLCNLLVVEGEAPGALAGLPAPDRVFVGGSGGRLGDILRAVVAANPGVRLCVAAITLETLTEALSCAGALGLRDVDVVQLGVAKAREVGAYHLMEARNPVYLVSAYGPAGPGADGLAVFPGAAGASGATCEKGLPC